jgi:hypothetical protein
MSKFLLKFPTLKTSLMNNRTISKYFIEIRFEPDAGILDKRGKIAASVLKKQFTDWIIQENKIDFSKKGNDEFGAYFSYRNLGIYSSYPNALPFIKNSSKDFIKSTWDYFKNNKIQRIGVRTISLTETTDYQKTFDAYKENFFKINEETLGKFDGKLYDVGFPMDFIDGNKFTHIMTGPMYAKQSSQHFDKVKDIPKYGIFVDVDYYMDDCSSISTPQDLIKFIEEALNKGKHYKEIIVDKVAN